MITAKFIMVGLALMIFPVFAFGWLDKKKQYVVAFALSCVMMIASLYCLYAGFHLLAGWQKTLLLRQTQRGLQKLLARPAKVALSS